MQINTYVTAQRCELKWDSLQYSAELIRIETTFLIKKRDTDSCCSVIVDMEK